MALNKITIQTVTITFTFMVELDDIVVAPGEVRCSYVIRITVVVDLPMRSCCHRPKGAKHINLCVEKKKKNK